MKKAYVTIIFFVLVTLTNAQTIIWTEDFESGGNDWTLNTTDVSSTSSGENQWVVNNVYAGCAQGAFTLCGFTSSAIPDVPDQPSVITAFPQSTYLHIVNKDALAAGCTNANYLPADGILCLLNPENYFSKMNIGINTIGQVNVSISFYSLGLTSTSSVGELYYSIDGGTTWTLALGALSNQTTWTKSSVSLQVFENQADLRFGFRFANNTSFSGSDPAFSVDQIEVSATSSVSTIKADFTSSDSIICAGTCIDFTDMTTGGATSWLWNFPGSDSMNSHLQNPTGICYSLPGTYDVILTATDGSNTDVYTCVGCVEVISADIEQSDTSACLKAPIPFNAEFSNSSYTYLWSNMSTNDSTTYIPSFTAYFGLNVSYLGVTCKDSVLVEVSDLVGSINAQHPGCEDSIAHLTAVASLGFSPYTYLWNTGAVTDTLNSVSPGTYYVDISDSLGCIYKDSLSVSLSIPPSLDTMYGPIQVVFGDTAYYHCNGNAGSSFMWLTSANMLSANGNDSMQIYFPSPGAYQIEVYEITADSCYSDTFSITVNALEYVGINDKGIEEKVSLYPQPAQNKVTLEWPQDIKIRGLELRSLDGKRLWQTQEPVSPFAFGKSSNISDGIYLLEIITPKAKLVRKVIFGQ